MCVLKNGLSLCVQFAVKKALSDTVPDIESEVQQHARKGKTPSRPPSRYDIDIH